MINFNWFIPIEIASVISYPLVEKWELPLSVSSEVLTIRWQQGIPDVVNGSLS